MLLAPLSKTLCGALIAMLLCVAAGSAQTAADGGAQRVPVMVVLRTGGVEARAVASRAAIRAVQEQLVRELGSDLSVSDRWTVVPGLAGRATPRGVARLRASPLVRAVGRAPRLHADLAESVALIKANQVHAAGVTGQGVTVAVLDSGVDTDHPDLADDIDAQVCFAHRQNGSGGCPDGTARQSGPGSAEDDDGHGTGVAAAITSRGTVAPKGVAPDAEIVAAKVLAADGAASGADVVSALDWLLVNRPDVRIVNMSLGSDDLFPGASCDGTDAAAIAYDSAFKALRRRGATVFVASGNEASASSLGSPACVSSAVAVGAVYDANVGGHSYSNCSDASSAVDKIPCFSNSGPALDLLAPGADITTAKMGGGTEKVVGTSFATPIAAGVGALLLQAKPSLSSEQVEAALKQSGVPVVDPRNGLTVPRIDAAAAVALVGSQPAPPSVQYLPAGAMTYSDPAGDGAVDIAGADVTTSGNGLVTVTVRVAGRTTLGAGEQVDVDFDVDRNRATGTALGGDVGIGAFPSGVFLFRFTGGRWNQVRPLGESSFSGGVLTVRLTEDELGLNSPFDFSATTFAGGSVSDRLPDSGEWPYPAFPLGVGKTGTGAGTVSGNGLDCGALCAVPVAPGAVASLTATAASGSVFVGWSGACGGSGACSVTMTGPASVTAQFEALRRLSVTRGGTGRGTVTSFPGGIACGSRCAGQFPHGASVTLTAAAQAGSRFAGWAGACDGLGECVVRTDAAKQVAATFRDVQGPTVGALASRGKRGRTAKLRYRLQDNSGRSRVQLEVLAGARRLAATTRPAARANGAVASAPWRAPQTAPAHLRFCARATDAAGNRSATSCAPLTLA